MAVSTKTKIVCRFWIVNGKTNPESPSSHIRPAFEFMSIGGFRPRCYTYKFASKLVPLVPHVRAEARARKFPVEVWDEKDYFFEIGCVETLLTLLGLAMSNYQQVTFSHSGVSNKSPQVSSFQISSLVDYSLPAKIMSTSVL